MKRVLSLALAAFLLLSVPVIACAEVDLKGMTYDELVQLRFDALHEMQSRPEWDELRPKSEYTVFPVGSTCTFADAFFVTLLGCDEYGGNIMYKPDDGCVYVKFNFLIENEMPSEYSVSSTRQFEAYVDDIKVSPSFEASASSDSEPLSGSIASGKKMRGSLCYQFPEDWEVAEFYFIATQNTKPVIFRITK